jgi:hypothetical protein
MRKMSVTIQTSDEIAFEQVNKRFELTLGVSFNEESEAVGIFRVICQ